jgi:hypothetical protein
LPVARHATILPAIASSNIAAVAERRLPVTGRLTLAVALLTRVGLFTPIAAVATIGTIVAVVGSGWPWLPAVARCDVVIAIAALTAGGAIAGWILGRADVVAFAQRSCSLWGNAEWVIFGTLLRLR